MLVAFACAVQAGESKTCDKAKAADCATACAAKAKAAECASACAAKAAAKKRLNVATKGAMLLVSK